MTLLLCLAFACAPVSLYAQQVNRQTPVYEPGSWLGWLSHDLRRTEDAMQQMKKRLSALGSPVLSQTTTELGYQHHQLKAPPPIPPWIQVDLGSPQDIDWIALVPALVDWQSGSEARPYGFPSRFRVDASNDPEFREFTSIATYIENRVHKQNSVTPVVYHTAGRVKSRYVRVTVNRLAEENGTHFFALSELMVIQGVHNIALKSKVTASNSANLPPRWHLRNLVDGRSPLGPPIQRDLLPYDGLFADQLSPDQPAWIRLDLGKTRPLDEIRLHPVHARLGADVPGFAFPLRYVVEVSDDPDFHTSHILLNARDVPYSNPGNNAVTIPAEGRSARYLRVLMHEASPGRYESFGLSEIEVYSNQHNIARSAQVTSTPDRRDRPEQRAPEIIVDGYTSYGRLLSLGEWMQRWERQNESEQRLSDLQKRAALYTARAKQRVILIGAALGLLLLAATISVVIRERHQRNKSVEKLRNRLAQDLHDEIGSNIAGIAMISETAAAQSHDPTQKQDWQEVNKIAHETTAAMREVLWLVGARAEAGPDFIALLQRTAARLLHGVEVRWKELPEQVPASWDAEARRQVFLFFKEALTNISRHARARHADLSLTFNTHGLTLTIQDDGRGFCTRAEFAGMGLTSMRARAKTLKGRMVLESEPQKGTLIQLLVPLSTPKALQA